MHSCLKCRHAGFIALQTKLGSLPGRHCHWPSVPSNVEHFQKLLQKTPVCSGWALRWKDCYPWNIKQMYKVLTNLQHIYSINFFNIYHHSLTNRHQSAWCLEHWHETSVKCTNLKKVALSCLASVHWHEQVVQFQPLCTPPRQDNDAMA